MLPFNTYSIHDLLGFMLISMLAGIFYIVYWKFGRRTLDLLVANFLAVSGAYCLVVFLEDNIIPQGLSSLAIPGAAAKSLLLFRIAYVVAILALVIQMHLALFYCKVNNVISRHIKWAYAGAILAIPLVWTPRWLKVQTVPAGEVGSWSAVVPWMPVPGPLGVVFEMVWIGTVLYSVLMLFRHRRSSLNEVGALPHTMLLPLGFLALASASILEEVLALWGSVSVAIVPIGAMVSAVLLATGLVRERMAEERTNQQMTREMELAATIQRNLLPGDHPPIPGYDLAGWSQSALHVGGDTYDFFGLPDGRWMITISDASGHGLGAAMMIAETRAILRSLAVKAPDPCDILAETHRHLSRDLPDGNFVTAFVGILDPESGTLNYASAGHGPIIFLQGRSGRVDWEVATAPPLGAALEADWPTAVRRRQLEPGDALVLVTDGFYEASDGGAGQFGIPRLLDTIRQARGNEPGQIIGQARRSVEAFQNGEVQADDMTMVVLGRRVPAGKGASMSNENPATCPEPLPVPS